MVMGYFNCYSISFPPIGIYSNFGSIFLLSRPHWSDCYCRASSCQIWRRSIPGNCRRTTPRCWASCCWRRRRCYGPPCTCHAWRRLGWKKYRSSKSVPYHERSLIKLPHHRLQGNTALFIFHRHYCLRTLAALNKCVIAHADKRKIRCSAKRAGG